MTAVAGGVPLLGGRKDTSRTILVVASFGAFLAFIDSTIVNVAFPSIQQDFPTSSIGDLSWVLNAYNVVFAAILVAGGRVADLLGRRRTFALGVVIFTIASLLCAISQSVGELIAWRALQAVGSALLVPASLAIVIEAFPGERRSHATGLWGAAAAFAAGIGPPIGGALVEWGGWRWAFLINLPLGAVAILLSRKELIESRAPGVRQKPDLLGLALFATTLGVLTTGIVKIPEWGVESSGVAVSGSIALVLLIAFVVRSRKHAAPAIDPELLRIPMFRLVTLLTVVAGMGFYAYPLTHILWLRYVWHYDVLASGMALVPGALVATAVAGIGGKIADKHGAKVLVVPGALIWALSFLWYLVMVDTTPNYITEWLPGQILSGFGVGMTLPILGSAGLAAVPGGRYALASGLISAARQLGGVLGVAILVVIIGTPGAGTTTDKFEHGWFFALCCFAFVSLGSLALRRAIKEAEVDDLAEAIVLPEPERTARPEPAAPLVTDGSVRSLLSTIPMFAALPAETLTKLVRVTKQVELPGGQELFHAGDEADALYVVRSGRVEIVGVDGNVIRVVGPGHVIGELALLTGGTRAATIRARRDSTFVRLAKPAFERVVAGDARASRGLASTLAAQIQGDTASVRRASASTATPRPDVIAVIAGSDETSRAVTSEIVAELDRLGMEVASPRKVTAAKLLELEITTDHVVLDAGQIGADKAALTWQQFCLRQADRIVIVAGASTRLDHLPHADELRSVDLVILDAPERIDELRAATGAQTVTARPRAELTEISGRLARRYAGRSVGLVLSGGGARGLSHLGVIAELEAAGIVVDRVTGASMGSFIAALYASGVSMEELDARCHEEYVRRNPVGGYRLPIVSLSSGKNGHAMLDRTFGDLRVEQLPKMLATTSVDIHAAELVVHDRGRIKDAVGASISLPAVFPPYQFEGRMLVDGGVMDNMPVAPLTVRDEGPIIVVDVADSSRDNNPERIPSLMETLMRSLTIASTREAKRSQDEVTMIIRPHNRGVGLLEFHQMDTLVEAGRVAAREALREHGHLLV